MKKYLRSYLATGSIETKKDGTARLIVKTVNGVKVHDKVHKTEKAAISAWYRLNA